MNNTAIDISYHNGKIDFAKVRAAGYGNVIIRAGYGKSTMDKQFINNITNAIANGFNIGIYWFIYASSNADVEANAERCAQIIAPYKKYINLKVWADWEYDSDKKCTKKLDKSSRSYMVRRFLEVLSAKGYDVGNYANPDYLNNKFDSSLDGYPLWLAQYSTKKAVDCWMWQHSSKGKVDGISGNVDQNIIYGGVFVWGSNKGNPYTEPNYTLYKGRLLMSKDFVKWLQYELNESETGETLAIDGSFGPKTDLALRAFQKKLGLKVDGRCGPLTKAALKLNKG